MFRLTALTTLMLLGGALLQAADVAGSWTGTIDIHDQGSGTTITTAVKLQLMERDGKLTGNIGRPEDAETTAIKDVKVEGNTLVFVAVSTETSQPCRFTLTINGDRMEGDMTTSLDSEPLNGKVKVTRNK